MSPSRLRGVTILALLALELLALLAWSQNWYVLHLAGRAGGTIQVPGSSGGGAVLPLALTGLVLIAALALAGPAFRIVLGVLQALLGLCIALQAGISLHDPVATARTLITSATGISDGAARLVRSFGTSAWPVVALLAGILLVVAGLALAVTATRWPASTRRFQRNRLVPADRPMTTIEEWDALSEGDDPTAGPR